MNRVTQRGGAVNPIVKTWTKVIRTARGAIGQAWARVGDLSFLVGETRPYRDGKGRRRVKVRAGEPLEATPREPVTRQELLDGGFITQPAQDSCEGCGGNKRLWPCPWCMRGFPGITTRWDTFQEAPQ